MANFVSPNQIQIQIGLVLLFRPDTLLTENISDINMHVSDWAKGMKITTSSPSPNPTFSPPLLLPCEDGVLIRPNGPDELPSSGTNYYYNLGRPIVR